MCSRATGPRPPIQRRVWWGHSINPRQQAWAAHFAWIEQGARIARQTPTGRATVAALELNRPLLVRARRRWIAAAWHPPGVPAPQTDAQEITVGEAGDPC